MKKLIFVLVSVLFSSVIFAQMPEAGQQSRDISLPDVQGNNVDLASLKGKVVLIDFWASWCKPCRKTIPELKVVYNKYQSKGFEIYAISVDRYKDDWKHAIKQDETNWIHVNDPRYEVTNAWGVQYIPTSFLLDKTGKIVAVNPSEDELDRLIPTLL